MLGRVFRSDVRPVEIGRKLVRQMDIRRTVGVTGRTIVPNSFMVTISPSDWEQFEDMVDSLSNELVALLKAHAHDEGYRFPGPVEVFLRMGERQPPGVVDVEARFREPGPDEVVALLVLPGGQRVPLSNQVVSIGRAPDSTIVLGDQNASRRHAEIRPIEGRFALVDLGSTNGTWVNGRRIAEQILDDGDELTFGQTILRYEDR